MTGRGVNDDENRGVTTHDAEDTTNDRRGTMQGCQMTTQRTTSNNTGDNKQQHRDNK